MAGGYISKEHTSGDLMPQVAGGKQWDGPICNIPGTLGLVRCRMLFSHFPIPFHIPSFSDEDSGPL